MGRCSAATAGGTVVDLFCGCGGFSLGAELAGYRSLAAIDIDSTLQSAYRRNFPRARAIQASVADIDRSDWAVLIGKIRPDGVIGGPPCQGFSRIGRRRKDDPRNALLHHFYRHVDLLRPKFFIMENVEGLLDPECIGELTSGLEIVAGRYRILGPVVVNAAHFGAATTRKRVVVIGYDPEEVDTLTVDLFQCASQSELVTVRDAIADLPSPKAEIKGEFGWAKYIQGRRHLSSYTRRLRAAAPSGLGWAEAVERHGEGYVSGMVATRHSPEIAKRYAILPAGKSDPITKSYKLDWNGQSPTLRAGTGADKGAFQAVRPLHPGRGRVITVREAARLQGFPDWFVFHETKWHSFRMIGNSMSPMVSEGLLRLIMPRMHLPLAA